MGFSRTRFVAAACAALLLLLVAAVAQGRPLYISAITVGSETRFASTNKFLDIPDLFDGSAIEDLFPGYDPLTEPFSAVLDLRGVPSAGVWDPTGSPSLTISIKGVIDLVFNEDTLEENLDQVEDWLKGDFESATATHSALTDLLQSLVRNSPVDPVAGNPNSLESKMFAYDYEMGTEGPFTSGNERLERAPNLFGVGIEGGTFDAGPYDVSAYDLPLDYRINLRNPKWSVLMNLPITFTLTQDQWSLMASGGLGVQYRPFDWWALTPVVRIGAVGSIDVGALAILYSTTLTSDIHFDWKDITFGMANMGGFAKSVDNFEVKDYELAYDITNPMTRNGGYVSGRFPAEVLGAPLGWKVFGSTAVFFGDDLFLKVQNEVGGSLNLLGFIADRPYQATNFAVSYIFGDDYDGVSIRLRFRF